MASNPYVNKVELADGTTVIDISDTTAAASDVASGKYFYTADGTKTQGTASGGGGAISVVDTTDAAGGTIRTITAVDISDTTATASDVASGKYFYTADGTKTQGTASGGSAVLTTKTITVNGTYDAEDDNADGYSSVTVNVSGGGGYASADIKSLIEHTGPSSFEVPSGATKIGYGAFYGNTGLTTITLPSTITTIDSYAFYNCTNMALSSLPSSLTTIGANAFQYCSGLTISSLPSSVTSIGNQAFQSCPQIRLSSLPSGITAIGVNCFTSCDNITISEFPSGLTSIGSNAFQYCVGLTTLSGTGAITSIGSAAFNGSSAKPMNITSISFPNMTTTSLGTAFGSSTANYACQKLAFADIGKTSAIAANAFANCYVLTTLVIRKTGTICTLSNVSAFTNTPMRGYAGQTGTVYVPNDLIATYQTASNWSTLYNNGTLSFVKIEGSPYE